MALENVLGELALDATLQAILAELESQAGGGGTSEVSLSPETLAALENVSAQVSGEVSLSPATLAALETITAFITEPVALHPDTLAALESVNAAVTGSVAVTNFPAQFPDEATRLVLVDILAELNQKLEAGQAIALDPPTLAALENITTTTSLSEATLLRLAADQPDDYPSAAIEALLTTIRDRSPILDAGRVPVSIGEGQINVSASFDSFISIDNSIDAPLAANEVFTGVWEDVRDFAAISVLIRSDQNSASNGAVVQFTDDPDHGVVRAVATTIPANVGSHFSLAPQGRYVRIVYTNGPAAANIISEVAFKFNAPAQVQQPLGAPITDANLATVVKSHLAGRLSTGQWASAAISERGELAIADSAERPYTPVVATVEAAGDTVIHTPAPGKAIRLRWMYAINDPLAPTSTLIKVRLGSSELYRVWALSKRQVFTGPVNGALVVNLSHPGTVAVSALIEEV